MRQDMRMRHVTRVHIMKYMHNSKCVRVIWCTQASCNEVESIMPCTQKCGPLYGNASYNVCACVNMHKHPANSPTVCTRTRTHQCTHTNIDVKMYELKQNMQGLHYVSSRRWLTFEVNVRQVNIYAPIRLLGCGSEQRTNLCLYKDHQALSRYLHCV